MRLSDERMNCDNQLMVKMMIVIVVTIVKSFFDLV